MPTNINVMDEEVERMEKGNTGQQGVQTTVREGERGCERVIGHFCQFLCDQDIVRRSTD